MREMGLEGNGVEGLERLFERAETVKELLKEVILQDQTLHN